MSVTELQFIHRVIQAPKPSTARFLLPNEGNQEDRGLIMRLDSKLMETNRSTSSTTLKTPVTAQFCGKTHMVAEWALWAGSFLQTSHISFIKLTNKISDAVQTKATRMLPLLLYMSLLVLALQAGALVLLFATALRPPGLWFLLVCVGILASVYWYTALPTIPFSSKASSTLPKQKSSS